MMRRLVPVFLLFLLAAQPAMKTAISFLAILLLGALVNHSAWADGQCAALYQAADKNDTARLKELIASGADVNCYHTRDLVEDDGTVIGTITETPLHTAATSANLAAVELLLASGADVNALNSKDSPPLAVISFLNEWFDVPDGDEVIRVLKQAGGVGAIGED